MQDFNQRGAPQRLVRDVGMEQRMGMQQQQRAQLLAFTAEKMLPDVLQKRKVALREQGDITFYLRQLALQRRV